MGYEYISEFGGPKIHSFFAKGPNEKRTHYVHVLKHNGKIWKNDLSFRDFLRNNKKRAGEYDKLKIELAKNFADDRKKYTSSKKDFIVETLRLAKSTK